MKIIKIIFIGFLILTILASIGIFVLLKTFDINRYKPQIIDTASAVLGRPVNFKDLDLKASLQRGIYLNLKQLAIQDDTGFQKGDFLTVKNISLGVQILPLFTKRQILVSRIHIDSPYCIIIRQKDGRINIQNLGKPAAAVPQKVTAPKAAVGMPIIFAETISVENGKVTFIDRSVEPESRLDVSGVRLKINQFSLTEPFSFLLEAAFLSGQKNIRLEGQMRMNLESNKISLHDIEMTADFTRLSLEGIRNLLLLSKDSPFPDELAGTLRASIEELTLDPKGLASLVMDLDLIDAQILFKQIAPGVSLSVSQIGLNVKSLSLDEPCTFSLKAAYLSGSPNLFLKGKAIVSIKRKSVKLLDTLFSTDLSSFSMSELGSSVAILKDVALPAQLKGKFNLNIQQIEAGLQGLTLMATNGELSNGLLRHKLLACAIEPIYLKFQITAPQIIFDELFLGLGDGKITAQGSLVNYLRAQNFDFNLSLEDLDLKKLLNQRGQSIKLEGFLLGRLLAQWRGFTSDSLRRSLLAEGNFEIKEGKLTDINVLKVVLSKLSMLPNLVAQIEASLPERYKEKLTKKDTDFTKAQAHLNIKNDKAYFEPIEIEAGGFVFLAKGEADFDKNFSLKGQFFIPEDLAASMVGIVPELEFLLDENRQILIPLVVSGKAPNVKFTVDVEYIAKQFIKERVKSEFDRALDKIFDRGKPPPEEGEPQTEDTTDKQKPEEKPIERQLIEGILDQIF